MQIGVYKGGETVDDLMISRVKAIEALQERRNLFCDNTPETFSKLSYAEKSRLVELDMAIATLINLPSAQPDTDEWCYDCKEYDPSRHCCPRFNRVIRETLKEVQPTIEERKNGKWIEVEDFYNRIRGRCSVCGWEAHMYEDDVVGMDYCPNCGARLENGEDV